ncbi:hypothetical protein D7D52_36145 [Nocardia yunnanensis]|uniref:Uncharacterized protein n=1 Tax=Nocardia yunnanensis TaxID=2382165 RepID=A0A386ZLR1_9NOCA|nr:hypothetical protein D7D52_36145 [Nocardia yunnanensis]
MASVLQFRAVLPAHAGMIRSKTSRTTHPRCAPARGDGPRSRSRSRFSLLCSSRTRGWSGEDVTGQLCRAVLPAYAGMVRPRQPPARNRRRARRTRGDGPMNCSTSKPSSRCSPCTRGWSVVRIARHRRPRRAPRAWGWSQGNGAYLLPIWVPPRTRGCSLAVVPRGRGRGVLPAHAGWSERFLEYARQQGMLPHACGDSPGATAALTGTYSVRRRARATMAATVPPTYARMVQNPPVSSKLRGSAPHARGMVRTPGSSKT